MGWEELKRKELKIYSTAPLLESIKYSAIEKSAPHYKKLLLYIKEDMGYYYENFEDHLNVGRWIIKRCLTDRTFLQKHKKIWMTKFTWFIDTIEKIESANLAKLKESELVILHRELFERYVKWHGYAYPVDAIDAVLNDIIRGEVKSALEKKFGKKNVRESMVNKYYCALTTPSEGSYSQREQKLLLEMALIILKDAALHALFMDEEST